MRCPAAPPPPPRQSTRRKSRRYRNCSPRPTEKKGESDVKVCQACHTFEKGAGAKIGPPLYGVIGRPKGSVAGFSYSDGMKAKGGNWTYEDINTFITKPSAFVSGTKMTYPGESDPQKRADILDYLQSDADTKVPFPQ